MLRRSHSFKRPFITVALSVCFAFIVQLSWAQSCNGYDGTGVISGSVTVLANGQLCLNKPGAPAEVQIIVSNVDDGGNPANFAVEIDWDDGSPRQVLSYGGPVVILNRGPHFYEIPSVSHTFLPRPCGSSPGTGCSYRPRVYLRLAGITCPAQFGATPAFYRYNTDDQCSGKMSLSETTSGNVIYTVTAGSTLTFTDRTILNCLPPQEIALPNSWRRWRRFVYGTVNTVTGTVMVNGASVAFPYAGAVQASNQPLVNSSPPFVSNNTLAVSIPATARTGEEFYIRMDYWNTCNPYGTDAPVSTYGIIRVAAPLLSQTISFNTPGPATYGDQPLTLQGTATSSLTVSYTSSNPNVATVTGSSVVIVGAGTTTITATQAGNATYSAAASVARTLTVDKAPLTVRAEDKSRTYGTANPTFTLSTSGFRNGDMASQVETMPILTSSADQISNVGAYQIVPTGGSDKNYSFVLINGTLTISKAVLTVTADNATRTYGMANPVLTLQFAGFRNADTQSMLDILPVATTAATVTSDAGNYNIIPGGGADNNYAYQYVNGSLGISKAVLTATASSHTRSYGQVNPPLSVSYSGFKNNELASDIDSPPVATTQAKMTTATGTYAITAAGGVDNNYAFNYVDGSMTIVPAAQSIAFATLNDISETVGSVILIATATSGLPVTFTSPDQDKVSLTGSTLSILKSGTVTISALQPGNNNFSAATTISHTFCIVPAKPTLTISAENEGYEVVSSSPIGNIWYLNGSLITGSMEASFTTTEPGAYQATVSVDGCISEISDEVVAIITSLETLHDSESLNVYPNPTDSELVIAPDRIGVLSWHGFIYNSKGEIVLEIPMQEGPFTLPVSQYKPGVYTVLIVDGKTRWTGKFIKN